MALAVTEIRTTRLSPCEEKTEVCPTDEVHAENLFRFDSFNGRCSRRPTGPQLLSASSQDELADVKGVRDLTTLPH